MTTAHVGVLRLFCIKYKFCIVREIYFLTMCFDEPTVQPVTWFFDMVEVETATAVGLYDAIKSSFEEKNSYQEY